MAVPIDLNLRRLAGGAPESTVKIPWAEEPEGVGTAGADPQQVGGVGVNGGGLGGGVSHVDLSRCDISRMMVLR